MTPQDLIAAFDVLADAPDGVKRLRELVLSLAVRGQLVAQDPEDEPASALLARVAGEKSRLIKEKRIRKPKKLPALPDGFLDSVPEHWRACRLQELLTQTGAGWSPKCPSHPRDDESQWGVLKTTAVQENDFLPQYHKLLPPGLEPRPHTEVQPDDLLVTRAGPWFRVGVAAAVRRWSPRLMLSDKIIRCTLVSNDLLFAPWLALCINHGPASMFLRERQTGMDKAQVNISQAKLRSAPVLVPPLAEQHRIVARVDELMGLLDRLEAARTHRDEVRTKARDAALADLRDAPDSEAVEAGWGRIARQMDDLFTAPDDVAPLRQAILQLAVRGRLVSQDPSEEPANSLLGKRATATKEPPFELPAGWAWSTLQKLGEIRGGGTPSKRNPRFWGGSIPWVSPKDMKRDFIGEAQDSITEAAVEGSSVKEIPENSLLMVVRGMILAHSFPTALTTTTVTINQDMKALLPFSADLSPYLLLATKGAKLRVLDLVERSTHGTCKLPTKSIMPMPIGIPPLAEQHRIVAKVDALMAICDDLEARLTAATDLHGQFAAAAVHHLDA